jgi:hypothetical protein
MAGNRQYEAVTMFGLRIVDMRHLWVPSHEFKGQQTQKPNYFGSFITPKTQAHWSSEPIFSGVMAAFGKLLQGQLQHFAQNPNAVDWPIKDGDMPTAEGKSSDWAKGHWVLSASSGNSPSVEMVQAGGNLVKLQNKVGVKPGDFVIVGATAAVKQNDARGVKFYLNGVVFTAPGEEIVFANSVSGAELLNQAKAQGMTVQGFNQMGGMQGGGFGQPNNGYSLQPAQGGGFGGPGNMQAGFAQPQNQGGGFGGGQPQQGPFGQPNGHGNAGGFAQTQGGNAMQNGANPQNNGVGGGFASPSNGGFGGGPVNQGGGFGQSPANPFQR